MKQTMIKLHLKRGITMHFGVNYIVRFSDNVIVVDDYVWNPDCKLPESKHHFEVFETEQEIRGLIDGTVDEKELDAKYAEVFTKAAKDNVNEFDSLF